MSLFFLVFGCLAAVAALLWAEYRDNQLLKWIAKPTASLCFVLLALGAGALETSYGAWILTALVFCLLGDILLIPAGRKTFLAGVGAFALGHSAYIAAFMTGGAIFSSLTVLAALTMVAAIAASLRWLWPQLGAMKGPVAGYSIIIAIMVAASFAAAPPAHDPPYGLVIAGAVGFAISDLAVARDQFVAPGFFNRLWGLPLYYGAQLMLASSV